MTDIDSTVPTSRIRVLNSHQPLADGQYVLYWMTAYRRTASNYALQRAVEWARHLGTPLVALSALRIDYRWASDRLHAFILDGMADVERGLAGTNAVHVGFVERTPGQGRGLLVALAENAAAVVTDDAPVFFLPQVVSTAASRVPVLMEAIDHNGLLPLRVTDRVFHRAYDLRRFLQRHLPGHLEDRPARNPLAGLAAPPADLADRLAERWPSPSAERSLLSRLPIDHSVAATPLQGGERAALGTVRRFIRERLAGYGDRNHPDANASSGLSP